MPLLLFIALKHLLARKRQSVVSLLGIVLGVAFFLAISSLMQGSQKDFIRRLVDNTPHITISDEFRDARPQPVFQAYPGAVVELANVRPLTETRGIRGYERILDDLRRREGLEASPVLMGQALISFAGRDVAISLNGMVPPEIRSVSTIQNYMIQGSVDNIIANPEGVIVGSELARTLAIDLGDPITLAAVTGQVRTFKVVGIFRTGRSDYDEKQVFMDIKRVQALLNRSNRANRIIMRMSEPTVAREVASDIERQVGYKTVSWQEASEDIMNTLMIRNIIMYTVVSAVLIVAGFGIYNVISTVVMEKHRDIAILKSMGFHARDIKRIFLIQGMILGSIGSMAGLPLGMLMMVALGQVQMRPPGVTDTITLPLDWGIGQFVLAAGFAFIAAVLAALLPARKGAMVQPVDILRGGA